MRPEDIVALIVGSFTATSLAGGREQLERMFDLLMDVVRRQRRPAADDSGGLGSSEYVEPYATGSKGGRAHDADRAAAGDRVRVCQRGRHLLGEPRQRRDAAAAGARRVRPGEHVRRADGQLAADRQVIAIELQGHGHTADIARSFTWDDFAEEIAAVIERLGARAGGPARRFARRRRSLRCAIRHPESVRKLVVISARTAAPAGSPRSWPALTR